jgi:hypothetical protein
MREAIPTMARPVGTSAPIPRRVKMAVMGMMIVPALVAVWTVEIMVRWWPL